MDRFKALQVVWAALMGGVLTFAIVVYVLLTVVGIQMAGLPAGLVRVVAPVAVVLMAACALLLRRKLVEAIPQAASAEERFMKYQAAVIQSLAVIEGLGLLIIVLSLISGESNWVPAGSAITLLMMAIARPRREEVETTRARSARLPTRSGA